MQLTQQLFHVDPINAFVALMFVVNTGYGLVVLTRNSHDKTNRAFFMLTLAVGSWAASMFFYRMLYHVEGVGVFLSRMLYASAAVIPLTFINFIRNFPDPVKSDRKTFLYILGTLSIMTLSLYPDSLITNVIENPSGGEAIIIFNKYLHYIYATYIVGYFCIGYIYVIGKLRVAENIIRTQLLYIFWGTFTSTTIGVVANLLMPLYGNFSLNWFGQVGVMVMVITISYAVLKHQLFNVKVIATELFVGILSSVFLFRFFFSENTTTRIIDGSVLISSLFFGYLLIKSVRREVQAREEIDKLAKRLASTNWELSRSNEQLQVMDQRKSEFVSIASHQLRTPVTAIKGYSSLILEDSYGKLAEELREPVTRIFKSSQRLVDVINDFLNVSKIEQGTMTYTFAPVDLRKMTIDLVEDFNVAAGEKQLDLTTVIPQDESFIVNADEGKIRQIISNLIDNAIKYTPKGSIRVILEKDRSKGQNGYIVLKIKDTGVGLSHNDLHHLFGKFARGTDGQKLNTSGSGLGLYVAKKMLEEHKGNIWVDSEGQGKGSTFCIDLPSMPN